MRSLILTVLLSVVMLPKSCQLYGQELKEVVKRNGITVEEYTVLKTDRKIKQGLYLSYTNVFDISDDTEEKEIPVEIGKFENNQKDGIWGYFDDSGRISKIVTYKEGEPSGTYQEFKLKNGYQWNLAADDISIDTLRDFVLEEKHQGVITSGYYSGGKAIGLWKFYSLNGELVHSYDYQSQDLKQLRTGKDADFPYLGGFTHCVWKLEEGPAIRVEDVRWDSQVEYKIIEGAITLESWTGDPKFKEMVINQIESVPDRWITKTNTNGFVTYLIFKFEKASNDVQIFVANKK